MPIIMEYENQYVCVLSSPCVSHVGMIIYGWTTRIPFYCFAISRTEFILTSSQRIVNFEFWSLVLRKGPLMSFTSDFLHSGGEEDKSALVLEEIPIHARTSENHSDN